jgi:RNase P subunit RPR2
MAKLEKIRCGGCGVAGVTLEGVRARHGDNNFSRLVATCSGCDSKTNIELSAPPVVHLGWGKVNQEGVLCVMGEDGD